MSSTVAVVTYSNAIGRRIKLSISQIRRLRANGVWPYGFDHEWKAQHYGIPTYTDQEMGVIIAHSGDVTQADNIARMRQNTLSLKHSRGRGADNV